MMILFMQQSLAFMTANGYLYIQPCEDGYDYTCYDATFMEIDGGQLDNPEFTIAEAAKQVLEEYFPSSAYWPIPVDELLEKVEV